MSDRPLRSCDACGQIDDHPRHQFDTLNSERTFEVNAGAVEVAYTTEGLDPRDVVRIVRDLEDTNFIQRHFDCCRDAGCPDGTCNAILEAVGNVKGYELVEAVTGEKVQ